MRNSFIFILALLVSLPVFANHIDRCTGNFVSTADKKAELERWLNDKAAAPNTAIYQKYKALVEAHADAVAPHLKNFAYDVLLDQEMLVTAKSLEKVIDDLQVSLVSHPGLSADERLRQVITKNLEGKVPTHTILERVNDFMNGGSIYRALGENTHVETGLMFHGGNPLAPTVDSALGKFLAKHTPETLVKKFNHGGTYAGQGPDKLVIPIDDNSMADFVELMKDQHLFTQYHTPNQGTLHVLHEDKIINWGGHGYNFSKLSKNFGESQMGMLFPTVLLSSTESQRMTQFLTGMSDESILSIVQQPWKLTNYCVEGGYNSCTHWVGNIPIGDEKVAAYTFPGKIDRYAEGAKLNDDIELDKLPRTKELGKIEFSPFVQLTDDQKDLIQRIWKTPGNMQFSYLLGIGKAQERGELANPGWVAQVLLSRVKADRSPVVFIYTPNAKEVLPADFIPKIRAY